MLYFQFLSIKIWLKHNFNFNINFTILFKIFYNFCINIIRFQVLNLFEKHFILAKVKLFWTINFLFNIHFLFVLNYLLNNKNKKHLSPKSCLFIHHLQEIKYYYKNEIFRIKNCLFINNSHYLQTNAVLTVYWHNFTPVKICMDYIKKTRKFQVFILFSIE